MKQKAYLLRILVALQLFVLPACTVVSENSKAIIFTSPTPIATATNKVKIFLGGSIDMGNAIDWQANVVADLKNENVYIFNPRRKDWDPSWKPEISNPNFKQQVEWELNALEASDVIIMYLTPNSQSPISLMEIGLYAKSGKLIVYCPEGFWRKGNVDALSQKYNIKQVNSYEELVAEVQKRIK